MNARRDLYAALMAGGPHSPQRSEKASERIEAFAAEVLREASASLSDLGFPDASALLSDTADVLAAADTKLTQVPPSPDAADVVAYRNPHNARSLLCRVHGPRYVGMVPVTAEDLPNGGTCTFGILSDLECGRDVLIDPKREAAS